MLWFLHLLLNRWNCIFLRNWWRWNSLLWQGWWHYLRLATHVGAVKERICNKYTDVALNKLKTIHCAGTALCCIGFISFHLYRLGFILGMIGN